MELAKRDYVEDVICEEVPLDMIASYEKEFVPEMKRLMDGRGIGLACPQVGVNKRLFIMEYNGEVISCYNPEIIFKSKQKTALRESCLTYPVRTYGAVNIMRPKTIQVRFTGGNGQVFEWRLRGINAKCFQHEVDHLDGITIFNRNKK